MTSARRSRQCPRHCTAQTQLVFTHRGEEHVIQCKRKVKRADGPEEDHAHARYGGRRGATEVVGLEEEVDVGSELDALSAGHGQQPVVIQHRVQALDPLWVDVPVAHDPRAHLWEENQEELDHVAAGRWDLGPGLRSV